MSGPLAGAVIVSLGGSSPARSARAVGEDLAAAARLAGRRLAVLAGEDPFGRDDLAVLLGLAARLGLAPGLAAPAASLSRPSARELVRRAGVAYLRVAAAAAWPPVDEAWEGIAATLTEAPAALLLEVALEVDRQGGPALGELVPALGRLPRRAALGLRLGAPGPGSPGAAWPEPRSIRHEVGGALARAVALGFDSVCWEGFPPCLLEAVGELRDETLRYGLPLLGPAGSSGLPREPAGSRVRPLACRECVHLETCPGAPSGFVASAGEGALLPSPGLRANAFNFEVRGRVDGLAVEAGRCRASALGLDPVRAVLLVRDDEVLRCETPTRDFGVETIREVKDRLEQVYLDASAGPEPDELGGGLLRLRFHSACAGCADRADCPGALVAQEEPPFRREERWLRKEVSRLRGRVLDVGCGDQRYRDVLAPLVASGEVDYHGLDPDAAALGRLRASGMGGTLHEGTIEGFEGQAGFFDYALLLRSWNHLRDLPAALEKVSRLLRPQGQLVVADSPVFALVRTAEQVARADWGSPAGHEHYRNSTSHQALELLGRYPFRVDQHRPVTPRTSCQWILKMMRVGGSAR